MRAVAISEIDINPPWYSGEQYFEFTKDGRLKTYLVPPPDDELSPEKQAAAATAVAMARGGGAPAPPKKVTVDRPFLFFVMDRSTGATLFMGRVLNPSSKG